jgi:hypothetical protein
VVVYVFARLYGLGGETNYLAIAPNWLGSGNQLYGQLVTARNRMPQHEAFNRAVLAPDTYAVSIVRSAQAIATSSSGWRRTAASVVGLASEYANTPKSSYKEFAIASSSTNTWLLVWKSIQLCLLGTIVALLK